MTSSDADVERLALALDEARATGRLGNVPVGAILTVDDRVVASAGNLREVACDPTAHAEILVLRQASQALGRWRMPEATLYVTLEPCAMCAGAIAQARIGRVVFGATEPKRGAIVSTNRLLEGTATTVTQLSSMAPDCAAVLTTFFESLRRGVRVVEGA